MERPALIDIGINLAHDSYDRDREAVIERAVAAGVAAMIVTGSSVASSAAAIGLAQRWPQRLRATVGMHPHHASDLDEAAAAELDQLMGQPGVCAGGECGLDYYRNFSPPEAQRAAFARQLELAVRHRLPVFLHEREAHADFLAILREHLHELPRAVLHCFTGSASDLDACLDAGLWIGITGWICDERRGLGLRELVGRIPADRLMLETDGPYLLPRNLDPRPRDRRNEPAFLPAVLEEAARCRGEAPEALAARTTTNALAFFDLRMDPVQGVLVEI